jgi:hypothetical protein
MTTNVLSRDQPAFHPLLAAQACTNGLARKPTSKDADASLDIMAMLTLTSNINFYTWSTLADKNYVHTTTNALNPKLP